MRGLLLRLRFAAEEVCPGFWGAHDARKQIRTNDVNRAFLICAAAHAYGPEYMPEYEARYWQAYEDVVVNTMTAGILTTTE